MHCNSSSNARCRHSETSKLFQRLSGAKHGVGHSKDWRSSKQIIDIVYLIIWCLKDMDYSPLQFTCKGHHRFLLLLSQIRIPESLFGANRLSKLKLNSADITNEALRWRVETSMIFVSTCTIQQSKGNFNSKGRITKEKTMNMTLQYIHLINELNGPVWIHTPSFQSYAHPCRNQSFHISQHHQTSHHCHNIPT